MAASARSASLARPNLRHGQTVAGPSSPLGQPGARSFSGHVRLKSYHFEQRPCFLREQSQSADLVCFQEITAKSEPFVAKLPPLGNGSTISEGCLAPCSLRRKAPRKIYDRTVNVL